VKVFLSWEEPLFQVSAPGARPPIQVVVVVLAKKPLVAGCSPSTMPGLHSFYCTQQIGEFLRADMLEVNDVPWESPLDWRLFNPTRHSYCQMLQTSRSTSQTYRPVRQSIRLLRLGV